MSDPHNQAPPTWADIKRLESQIEFLRQQLTAMDRNMAGVSKLGFNDLDTILDAPQFVIADVCKRLTALETVQTTHADLLMQLDERISKLEGNHTDKPLPVESNPIDKPKCWLCDDTKILRQYLKTGDTLKPVSKCLCECLKVGDVVSAEVANLLPVGSRVRGKTWTILRIGPGDEATATTDTIGGTEKSDAEFIARCRERLEKQTEEYRKEITVPPTTDAKPDNATTTIEPLPDDPHDYSDSPELHGYRKRCAQWIKRNRSAVEAIRKHGVGREPTLAEVLARPDMKPIVDVVRAAIVCRNPNSSGCDISRYVDAISPDVRKMIEEMP